MSYQMLSGSAAFLQKEIPPAAWIALILIALFVIILNYGLWSAWKKKRSKNYDVILKASRAIRHPFEDENQQLEELSSRVAKFKTSSAEKEAGEESVGGDAGKNRS
jgi:hypothetical protein